MIPEVVVSPIELCPSDAAGVANWIRSTWGRLCIHDYFDAISGGQVWKQPLPRTLVAHIRNKAVGTVSVMLHDLETRPDLNPWLGCLYVQPAWRCQGVAGELLMSAEQMAAQSLGISVLHL